MVFLSLNGGGRRKRRQLPTSVEQLLANDYMLEHIISKIYGVEPNNVRRIRVRLNSQDDIIKGHLSDSGRVSLTAELVDGLVITADWFLKVKPQTADDAKPIIGTRHFDVFNNEMNFYTKILPAMQRLLVDTGLACQLSLDVPRILFCQQEEEQDTAILILEDVYASGYRHIRDANGCKNLGPIEAVAALQSLARIQAVFHVARNTAAAVSEFDSVWSSLAKSGMMWATQESMVATLGELKESFCRLLAQSSRPDAIQLMARFCGSFRNLEDRLVELCEQRMGGVGHKPNNRIGDSLQHGDLHFNNIMFKKTASGELRVMLVDWQLAYCGRHTGDVAYLLFSSVSRQQRLKHEAAVRAAHAAAYNDALKMLLSSQQNLSCEPHNFINFMTESVDVSLLRLPLLLACGNIMTAVEEEKDRTLEELTQKRISFAYEMCSEAVLRNII